MDENNIKLEQYKLYVEMADKISTRRNNSNIFFSSLLSGLLAVLSFVFREQSLIDVSIYNTMLLFVGIMGLFLSISWFFNIRSYRQLNTIKFEIINGMEEELPFKCYKDEWEKIKEKKSSKTTSYLMLTKIEQTVPIIFMLLYIIFIGFAFINLTSDLFGLLIESIQNIILLSFGVGIGFLLGWLLFFYLNKRKLRKINPED